MVPFGTARSGDCHRRFAKRNAATEAKAFGHGSCMPRVVGTANTEPKDIWTSGSLWRSNARGHSHLSTRRLHEPNRAAKAVGVVRDWWRPSQDSSTRVSSVQRGFHRSFTQDDLQPWILLHSTHHAHDWICQEYDPRVYAEFPGSLQKIHEGGVMRCCLKQCRKPVAIAMTSVLKTRGGFSQSGRCSCGAHVTVL